MEIESRDTSPTKFTPIDFEEKLTFVCKFCGGASCKLEDYRTNSKLPNAITGLNSNWITQNILAMQRPSQRLIQQFNLYQEFKKQNIITILNLQQPGEHPYCGDGIILSCGFSYIPENLFKYNISFFNHSWEDMTATTSQYMMKIMNTFAHTFQQGGKIAVHCHAGRGRTLLAICSWLIFDNKFTAEQVIKLAVDKREGVLSKNSQREFLFEFQKFLKNRRMNFGIQSKYSFEKIISQQQQVFLKKVKSECLSAPFVHHQILKQINLRLKNKSLPVTSIRNAILDFNNQSFPKWGDSQQTQIKTIKNAFNIHQVQLSNVTDIRILTETLFDFYDELPYNPLNVDHCEIIAQQRNKGIKSLQILMKPELINNAGIHTLCTILNFVQFLITLKNFEMSNLQLQLILNRIVKCFLSKKKYSKSSYTQRQLKTNIQLYDQQKILKDFMISLMIQKQENQQNTLYNLIMKIKKVAFDIYFHLEQLKQQKSTIIFSQKEMDNIYVKCTRK